jgi:Methyltransferase domain
MKWFLVIALSLSQLVEATDYLHGRLDPSNSRYITFRTALQLIIDRNLQVLVETGCMRSHRCGEGCSTLVFSDIARDRALEFYSFDTDRNSIATAQNVVSSIRGKAKIVRGDSVTLLGAFEGPIDFLYLDSLDFIGADPDPSQQHHLKEIQAAYPHLHEKSVVMIDDCGLEEGGKGKLVIAFLLEHGWKVLQSDYQVILIHN